MARFRYALALALAALPGLTSGAAHAQTTKPAAAAKAPSQADMQRAVDSFRVLMSALQSDKVPQPVKNILFLCVYSNPFSKIADGTEKALAARKADRTNPTMMLGAMAAVCGLKPEMLTGVAPKK